MSKVGNIWFLCPFSVKMREFSFLSLYTFLGKCVYFLLPRDSSAFSVCILFEENVIIFQFLNDKHTLFWLNEMRQKPNISHLAFMITCNIVSALWMSFHPLLEGPNEQVTQKYMKGSRYVQLLLYFILISLKVWFILAIWNLDNKHVVLFKLISYFSWFVMHLFKIHTCTLRVVISKLFDMAVYIRVKSLIAQTTTHVGPSVRKSCAAAWFKYKKQQNWYFSLWVTTYTSLEVASINCKQDFICELINK